MESSHCMGTPLYEWNMKRFANNVVETTIQIDKYKNYTELKL